MPCGGTVAASGWRSVLITELTSLPDAVLFSDDLIVDFGQHGAGGGFIFNFHVFPK